MAFSMGFSFRGPWGPGQTIFWSRWTEFHLSNWLLSVIDSKRFFYMDYYTGNIWENLKYIPGKKRWIGIINMDKNDELSSMLVMEIHHWYIPNYWYIYIYIIPKQICIYIYIFPLYFFPLQHAQCFCDHATFRKNNDRRRTSGLRTMAGCSSKATRMKGSVTFRKLSTSAASYPLVNV